MATSTALTALGIVGAASYFNIISGLAYDAHLIRSVIPCVIRSFIRSHTCGLNQFYTLQGWAKSKSHASRTLIQFEGRSYTYAEVYESVLCYGTWLREKQGVQPGDIVAMDFQNSTTFIFVWFGLWSIGAKPSFINYNLTGDSLVHCIKVCDAKLVLIDPAIESNFTEQVTQGLPHVKLVTVTPELDTEIQAQPGTLYPNNIRYDGNVDNMAMLIYTSGTTGLPKPAIVSVGKATIAGSFFGRWLGTTYDDIFYTAMPLYHSSASLLGFLNMLEAGASIALSRKFSARGFWRDVRQTKATIVHYVGETCRYLVATPSDIDPDTGENLDKKHHVHTAFGNGLRPDVWRKFKDRFGIARIAEWYAATEGPFATFNLSTDESTEGAMGRNGTLYNMILSRNVRVVEVDPITEQPWRDPKTGLCRKVKPGLPGELMFRLPPKNIKSRFQGYYGNDKDTSGKILRGVFSKDDAWFRSGDMVIWDSNGMVYFSDRIGDTFRWKSENVSTAEVAQEVGLHPMVLEPNVYGVELPKHDGRCGCAALVFRPEGLQEDGQPSADVLKSLADHVEKRLPRFARPIFLRVLPQIDTTGTFKQLKKELRIQGVDPDQVDSGKIYWLSGGTYLPFERQDWDKLISGGVKL